GIIVRHIRRLRDRPAAPAVLALGPVDEIGLTAAEEGGMAPFTDRHRRHVHTARRAIDILEPPAPAAILRNAEGRRVVAAVPLLAGPLDAAEDRQQPGAVITNEKRSTNKAAARQVEITPLPARQLLRITGNAQDFDHADTALVLIAGRLGGVEKPQPSVRSREEDRILF